MHVFIVIFLYTIATVSLRTITISGQFPLAHAAFMGIGAYVAGIASKWLGWPAWGSIPLGALTAMIIGMITAWPFARLSGLYYAMGSLFLGTGIIYIINAGGIWTGGYSGMTGIQPLFSTYSKVPYYYFFLGLVVVSIIALYRFEVCRIGTTLKAIAQSQLVASSVGINIVWYRVLTIGVGCFFAGLAGACYAHYNLVLSPYSFNAMATLWLCMYTLIGGINNIAGPIIGTFVLILVPEYFRGLKMYSPFLSAALLGIVVYLLPEGLVSLPKIVKGRVTRRSERRSNHAS
jgi:branched-chain amino acid transport system permease protein